MSNDHVKATPFRQDFLIAAALLLWVVLLRLPSWEQPFDNDGSAIAYHAQLILEGAPLYSSHHPGHHMPASYYTFALAFFLFGPGVWSVKFLLTLTTFATAYLIYRLGILIRDRTTGIVAAVFYTVLTAHIWLWGVHAQTELFANLPRVAALLLFMYLVERQETASWKFSFVGVLTAMAFLYKAVYVSPLVLAGIILLVDVWQNRAASDASSRTLRRIVWIGLGFVVSLLSVVVYFGLAGVLPRFFMVFTLGQKYVNDIDTYMLAPQQYWFLFPFLGLGLNNAILLILSLAGLLLVFAYRSQWSTPVFHIGVWYILSLGESLASRLFFLHYYLLIVPALVLLAAWFLLKLYSDSSNRPLAILLPVLLVTAALLLSARQNWTYYSHYLQYRLGQETYEGFLLKGWPLAGEDVVKLQALSSYLEEHTTPSDRIYYWSETVQLYYMSNRRSPIDILWPIYVAASGPVQRVFAPQTKYIVVDPDKSLPNWLKDGIADNYMLEIVIHEQQIYRRAE